MKKRIHPDAAATLAALPPEYHQMKLSELRARFTGPDAPECPPELCEWLEAANLAHEVRELKRRNDERELALQLSRGNRVRGAA